jgi:hypothetical protein
MHTRARTHARTHTHSRSHAAGLSTPAECADINECERGTHSCGRAQRCINLSPGFQCGECPPGTVSDLKPGGAGCVVRLGMCGPSLRAGLHCRSQHGFAQPQPRWEDRTLPLCVLWQYPCAYSGSNPVRLCVQYACAYSTPVSTVPQCVQYPSAYSSPVRTYPSAYSSPVRTYPCAYIPLCVHCPCATVLQCIEYPCAYSTPVSAIQCTPVRTGSVHL